MGKKNKHFFYVLECSDGSFYGGYTIDPIRRLAQHNNGKGAKYTRMKAPVKMIYTAEYDDKTAAMRAEYAFKQLPRLKKEQFLREAGEWDENSKEL
ncbi:GIY-YIG nuclease family protein [Lederbergia lenta]|uniref:Excinuclease ABC C subunit domain-containing protein n=1 Tax=Lederbergia lenta TaxID=1467 RepID=A0A2X4VWT7_LEDLE|nr:GIY-YIG nuclease family protein [Lederbergia lenta]MEC2323809.1 GIY-YIG nuclease family protein [Lederbergia lenta]SQI51112.1 excinuclease ABC C subunit domain-containing protein [Lederbergia lenta]